MAVYKVIQDIEAEDKLVGFLTLKGFIYAGMAAVLAFVNFQLLVSGAPPAIKLPIFIVFAFPMVLFGVLASPLGREQPTEVWLLSRIRFFLKPKRRIWSQFGISDLVTITAPRKIERQLTKNFTQTEVESRLKALALTLDSRGWAVKNVNVNLNTHPDYLESTEENSDRLVAPSSLPDTQPVIDVHPSDDILDEKNNETAKKFNNMMKKADEDRKKQITERLSGKNDDEISESTGHFVSTTVISPGMRITKPKKPEKVTSLEERVLEKVHRKQKHLIDNDKPMHHLPREKVLTPSIEAKQKAKTETPVTSAPQAVKLELAQSGSDLSVASIASLANRKSIVSQTGPNEVTISLH